MHLRFDRRIQLNKFFEPMLNRITGNPNEMNLLEAEENYVEDVSKRYYRLYRNKYGDQDFSY